MPQPEPEAKAEGRTYANFVCVRPAGQKPTARSRAVAVYHLSVKTISRSAGRSATAAAAYRAAAEITDERTGEVHDYSRKRGVESTALVIPENAPEWAANRAELWNAAEQSETRKNSTVAREFEIALPSELSADERKAMAHDFARAIVERHGCAADVAIHAPGKEGNNRNHHAHILCTTRRLTPDGFGEKCRELDDRKTKEVEGWRERFADLQNAHLERAGVAERVDHRSLKEQGIEREPTQHLGPAATGYERRTGEPSDNRTRQEQQAAERLANAQEMGVLEKQSQQVERSILNLSNDIQTAIQERDQLQAAIEKDRIQKAEVKAVLAMLAEREEKEKKEKLLSEFNQMRAERVRRYADLCGAEAQAAHSKPTPQEDKALQLREAVEKQKQWDKSLKDERELYLRELTRTSRAKAIADMAEHSKHLDAKPLLFGRGKWEEQRKRFENRDNNNASNFNALAKREYPFIARDKEAVQKAVEQRVSDKNPELTRSMPKVKKTLLEARNQAERLWEQERIEEQKKSQRNERGRDLER